LSEEEVLLLKEESDRRPGEVNLSRVGDEVAPNQAGKAKERSKKPLERDKKATGRRKLKKSVLKISCEASESNADSGNWQIRSPEGTPNSRRET